MAPKIAHFDFGETPTNFEDSVSINCLVSSGDLPLDIEWLFNDYPLNSYSGITATKMGKRLSVLMIDSVNARHVGNYTCKAKNLWAASSYTAQLIVNGSIGYKIQNLSKHMYIYFVVILNFSTFVEILCLYLYDPLS